MSGRNLWAVALVLGGLAFPARAAEKLEWKFKQGDTFYVKSTGTLNQTLTASGKRQDQEIGNDTIYSFTVLQKNPDGTTVLQERVESLAIRGASGFGGGETAFNDQVRGTVFKITLSPAQKITKFEGYDQLVTRIRENSEENAKLFQAMLPQQAFEQAARQLFEFLPGKAVDKGAKWETNSTLPMASLGSFKVVNHYTLQEVSADEARIGVTSAMTYVSPAASTHGSIKLTKADIKGENARGTIVFNVARGRLNRADFSMTLRGTLSLETQGNVINLNLDQTRRVTLQVSDMNPAEE